MKLDLDFIGKLKKSKIFNEVAQIPRNDNTFEYAIEQFDEGQLMDTLYLEHEILDDFNRVIGHFGVNFDHKVLAYNLKREGKNDYIIGGKSRYEYREDE